MSRLWDTPEFWARTEADELLRDIPNTSVAELAASVGQCRQAYENDPAFVRDVTRELLMRVSADIRFWPEEPEVAALEKEVRGLLIGSPVLGAGQPPTDYWWQRI